MNILFFTNISPFPQNGGEKIRSYFLIKALADLGHRVFAMIGNKEEADLLDYSLENVTYYVHQEKPWSMADRITGKYHFQRSPEVLRLFEKICTEHPIDVALLDYGFIGHYIRFFTARRVPVILGTHNSQALHTLQMPAKGLLKQLRRSQLVAIEKLHERRYFKQAAAVMVVSGNDLEYHKEFITPEKLFVVPNFLDENEYQLNIVRDPKLLVMTANFSMYMNYEGLKWFVEKVWDDDLAARFQLLLVGRHSQEALIRLKGNNEWKNIRAVGKVDDVKPFIAMAAGVVIPLLHGSGTRLKCLEAMALKTPVISTSKGVEGVISDNFIIADTTSAFKNALLTFNGRGHLGTLLQEDFMQEYSAAVNSKRLSRIIRFVKGEGQVTLQSSR